MHDDIFNLLVSCGVAIVGSSVSFFGSRWVRRLDKIEETLGDVSQEFAVHKQVIADLREQVIVDLRNAIHRIEERVSHCQRGPKND